MGHNLLVHQMALVACFIVSRACLLRACIASRASRRARVASRARCIARAEHTTATAHQQQNNKTYNRHPHTIQDWRQMDMTHDTPRRCIVVLRLPQSSVACECPLSILPVTRECARTREKHVSLKKSTYSYFLNRYFRFFENVYGTDQIYFCCASGPFLP